MSTRPTADAKYLFTYDCTMSERLRATAAAGAAARTGGFEQQAGCAPNAASLATVTCQLGVIEHRAELGLQQRVLRPFAAHERHHLTIVDELGVRGAEATCVI